MSDLSTRIASVKIYPSIGIARVGNSPTGFFVGPERVGATSAPQGGFKDAQGRMKRQAARFRIFAYDKEGRLLQEITKKDAAITWTVHLANKKAAWKAFDGLNRHSRLRNAAVRDRASLVIDPGPRSTTGSRLSAKFDTGTFMGRRVPLGEIRTESDGRLLVLGGFGRSSSPKRTALVDYANNDGWHDDVSDGPVTAEVRLKGANAVITAAGAWVIVGPPDFAPSVGTTTTLYDVLRQRAVDTLGLKPPDQPSFTQDIYPFLARTVALKWVSAAAGGIHDFLASVIPPNDAAGARQRIFMHLRNPSDGGGGNMPKLFSDAFDKPPHEPDETITRLQYALLRQWSEGDFVNDWTGSPVEPEITPDGLTRAALEACVGGPFFPGIEAGWRLRDVAPWSEPFRLDHAHLDAGDLTKQMAVPWQADFHDCRAEGDGSWWPSQRPDAVFPEATGPDGPQVEWTRDIIKSSDPQKGRKEMVDGWSRLGIVAARPTGFLETERKRSNAPRSKGQRSKGRR